MSTSCEQKWSTEISRPTRSSVTQLLSSVSEVYIYDKGAYTAQLNLVAAYLTSSV